MTPTELRNLGKKLGEGWQTKLARLMPCNVRTVRRMLAGDTKIREMAADRIRKIIEENAV